MDDTLTAEAPDLLNAQECADLLGIDLDTWSLHVVCDRAPRPYQRHGHAPVWDRETIIAWKRSSRAQRVTRGTER